MLKPQIFLIVTVLSASGACNSLAPREGTSAPKASDTQKSLTKSEQTTVDTYSDQDETVSPPTKVSGSYLLCRASDAAPANELAIDCNVYNTVDNSPSAAAGLWNAVIAKAEPGESIVTPDPSQGLFTLKASSRDRLPAALTRVTISFQESEVGADGSRSIVTTRTIDSSGLKSIGAPLAAPICPAGYVQIPADKDFGTASYCSMKYEAKKSVAGFASSVAAGTPWVNISQLDAIAACRALGTGYDLFSNPEWMTLASNATSVASNWTGAAVGSGKLFTGHSDSDPNQICPAGADDSLVFVETDCTPKNSGDTADQSRIDRLSNGSIVWDLSANVDEVINYNASIRPSPSNLYVEFPALIPIVGGAPISDFIPRNALKAFWNDSWNSTQGIGDYLGGFNGTGGAMVRGGDYSYGAFAGIFAVNMSIAAGDVDVARGFRCAYHPPAP